MNKKVLYILLAITLGGVLFSFNYYQKVFGSAVVKNGALYIKQNSTLQDLKQQLTPFVKNSEHIVFASKIKRFNSPKPGKYLLKKGMSLNAIINKIRIGDQTPVKVAFNNQDTLEKLAGRIAQQLEADSISLLKVMLEPSFLKKYHFTSKSALGMYIPNSYEYYWNTSPTNFRSKMLKNYRRFWTTKRLEKAKKLNLSKSQVITLASIVQKETAQRKERPIVAGLYLNRLKNGWPLQADPTVIFALKEQKGHDIIIKRVLNKDLKNRFSIQYLST